MEDPGLQLQSPISVAGPASWKQHKDTKDLQRNSACKRPLARHHAKAHSVMDPSGLEDVTRDALGSSPFLQPGVLQALRGRCRPRRFGCPWAEGPERAELREGTATSAEAPVAAPT